MSSTYVVKDKGGAIVATNVTKKVMLETVRGLLKSGKMKYRGISRWNVPKKDEFNKMFDASRIIKGRVTEMTVADPVPEEPVVKAKPEHKIPESTKVTVAKKGFHTIDENSAAMDVLVTQVLGTDTPDTFNDLLNADEEGKTPAHAKNLDEWQNDTSFLQELIEDAEQHIDNILIEEPDFSDAAVPVTSETVDEVVVVAEDTDTMDYDLANDGNTPTIPDDEAPTPSGIDNGDDDGHDIFDDIADFRKRIEDHLNANTFDASGFDRAIADESAAIEAESIENATDDTFEAALASIDTDIDETTVNDEITEFDDALTPLTIDDDFGDIFSFTDKDPETGSVTEEAAETETDFAATAKAFMSDVKLDIEEKVEELRSTGEDGTPAIVEKLDAFTDTASEKIDEGVENIKEKFERLTEKFEDVVPESDAPQMDTTEVDEMSTDNSFGDEEETETVDGVMGDATIESDGTEENTDTPIADTDITIDEDGDEVVENEDGTETVDEDDYDYDDDLVYRGDESIDENGEPIDEFEDTVNETVEEDIDELIDEEPAAEYDEAVDEELTEDIDECEAETAEEQLVEECADELIEENYESVEEINEESVEDAVEEYDDEPVEEEFVETVDDEISYGIGDSVADMDGRFLGTIIGVGEGVVFLPVDGDEQSAKVVSVDEITMYEDSMENILGDIDAGGFDIEVLTARFREFVKAKQG